MNALESMLAHPFAQALGWALLHFIWQGVLVAIVLAGALAVLRGSTANVRYGVSCAALLLMLALPIGTILVIGAQEQPAASSAPAFAPTVPQRSRPMVKPADSPVTQAFVSPQPPKSWRQAAYERLESLRPWLISVWIMGVLLLSFRLMGGWLRAQQLKRKGTNPVAAFWQERVASLCEQMRISRTVRVVESALVQAPMVIGWLRPVILLPVSAFTGLMPRQLEAILAHELSHIRRYDYLINLMQTAVETLLFYHPAVWWVSRQIRVERENCCDDVAVAVCGDALIYARALTEMESLRAADRQLAVAANGGSLLNRVRRLVGAPAPGSNRFAGWLAGVIVITAVITVGAGAQISLKSAAKDDGQPADDSAKPQKAERVIGALAVANTTSQASPQQVVLNETMVVQAGADAISQDPDPDVDVDVDPDPDPDPNPNPNEQNPPSESNLRNDMIADAVAGALKGLSQEKKCPDCAKKIADALAEALKDVDLQVRQQALMALASMGDKRVVEPLIAALKDADAGMRRHAAGALGSIGDERAVDALITALKDSDAGVRRQAAASLGAVGDKRAVEPLMAAMKDADAGVRRQAAASLGAVGDARAVPGLNEALKDADAGVRRQAAASLGAIGDKRSVEPLMAALKDEDVGVRRQAAASLGAIGDERAVDGLITALKDADAGVRRQAASALSAIQ